MCTLTFIPKSLHNFVLTSNRDEAPARETLVPAKYIVDGVELHFPKDQAAGGTWIGTSSKKRLICLLNGGFKSHNRAAAYKMSRGVIVTQLLTVLDYKEVILQFDFQGIEPFTLVLIDWEKEAALYELVWDGKKIYFEEKPWAPRIWSSSLLYSQEAKLLREQWFSEFLFTSLNPDVAEILKFHKSAGMEKDMNALVMDRGFVKTKSITQVSKDEDAILMRYEDLQTNTVTKN